MINFITKTIQEPKHKHEITTKEIVSKQLCGNE